MSPGSLASFWRKALMADATDHIRIEQSLITALTQRFAVHPSVDAVFGAFEGKTLSVFVFLADHEYDIKVMSAFSGYECELRRSYPHAILNIEYVPARAAMASGILPVGSFRIKKTTN
jgi:hypothetical protein